jgi:hypothetical protein
LQFVVGLEPKSLIRCFEFRGERPSGGASAAIKKGDCSMTKLELLYAQKSKKFDQVCALVAREFGYGELPLLSDEDRSRVEDEAKQYVERWEDTVEMRTSPTIRLIMPLRRLLAEHHDICERILDEQEMDAGLWAYRKRAEKRRARRAF